jgi:hypothetical protein
MAFNVVCVATLGILLTTHVVCRYPHGVFIVFGLAAVNFVVLALSKPRPGKWVEFFTQPVVKAELIMGRLEATRTLEESERWPAEQEPYTPKKKAA